MGATDRGDRDGLGRDEVRGEIDRLGRRAEGSSSIGDLLMAFASIHELSPTIEAIGLGVVVGDRPVGSSEKGG
jgi:hypothetical protein